MDISLNFLLFLLCTAFRFGGSEDSFIIGGDDAHLGQFPYQASIQFKNGGHFCGGTVVKNNYILSAAHCFTHKDTQNAEYLQVWIGGVDLDKQNDKGVTVGVEKIVLADYDDHTKVNDIAVLKLKKGLTFSDKIKKVEYYDSELPENTNCTVSGWGIVEDNGTTANPILQYAQVIVQNHEKCNNSYVSTYGIDITDKMTCAAENNADSCKGDSGGPLICGGKQAGLVSFGGEKCADERFPGVYTLISAYQDWIENATSSASRLFKNTLMPAILIITTFKHFA